ncbi:class F sortase [Streptomyces sp. CB02923]|uniref:class F sortase n=1 Tax=Streptomyces sp. CB02923 TaxID=1718985 RepID=UPI00093E79FA|nr:class F sortase [Streptomyces sp. CB02923]
MSRRPHRRLRDRLLTAACLLLLVGGGVLITQGVLDSGASGVAPPVHVANTGAPAAGPRAKAPAALPAARPVRVRIPAAGVDTGPVLGLGLASDGTVQVPSVAQADRIGWYDQGVTPGETGPAVLIGHYDTVDGPAVLRDVGRIGPGDRIYVDRADGRTAVFAVRELQQVDKKAFPTQRVYGDTDRPELRLVTCGGGLVNGHRPDNIVVYADLVAA